MSKKARNIFFHKIPFANFLRKGPIVTNTSYYYDLIIKLFKTLELTEGNIGFVLTKVEAFA